MKTKDIFSKKSNYHNEPKNPASAGFFVVLLSFFGGGIIK